MSDGGKLGYTFITGGASSGKSSFALGLLQGRNDVTFIATGVATDPEMEKRITAHKNGRPKTWETIEEPVDIIGAARRMIPRNRGLIVDCLTFWVSNQLYSQSQNQSVIIRNAEETARFLQNLNKTILVVTNEIGMGIIPKSEETRLFRKVAGEVNQVFARMCKEAYMVVSGIGTQIR
jgi:adenosyl cobinamide kinase/adenosyl cobinamide phosphate guanylyltransferase